MPRKPRLHYEGALYHVLTRGNNKQRIFTTEQEYSTFLAYLKALKKKKPFYLLAYCLMPNHVHLLIKVEDEPLSAIMQRLLVRYTKYFNVRNRKEGHLFQGRYKATICRKENYLLQLVRYMHLNPIRAKIVEDASGWRWSSHLQYMCGSKNMMVDEDEVLKCFSDDKSEARAMYKRFMGDFEKNEPGKEQYPDSFVPYPDKEEYVEKQKDMNGSGIKQQKLRTQLPEGELNQIFINICISSAIEPEIIKGDSKKKEVAGKRKEFIIKAYNAGYKAADIARFISRTPSFISKITDNL